MPTTPNITTTNQPISTDQVKTAAEIGATTTTSDSKPIAPLGQLFLHAVEENKIYYAAKKSAGKFSSPLFKLVQRLKSHPELKELSAKDAFISVNTVVQPDWEKLFPDVAIPSLEFITAWEQVNIPDGVSPLQIIQRNLAVPLKLLEEPICEGYPHYLGIAFHLQRLTPRRDILMPVEPLSAILATLIGKSVSPQSVSYYCRQAKKDGYIKLVAKAHHPSGKAARYRFDLSRFTTTGEELAHNESTDDSTGNGNGFSQGNHGSQGNDGTDGKNGNEESSSSSVLEHAKTSEQNQNENQQGEKENGNIQVAKKEEKSGNKHSNTNEQPNTGGNIEIKEATLPREMCPQMPQNLTSKSSKKKKQKVKRQSVVALWQSVMYSRSGWQEKLSDDDYDLLIKFGRRTDEFGFLILQWAMDNWDKFGREAVGETEDYPPTPTVAFFSAYQAIAFNLWRHQKVTTEDQRVALETAVDKSNKELDELIMLYPLGEDALFHNVAAQLEYKGLLKKHPTKGWEVCGHVFKYKTDIDKRYCNDEDFRNLLKNAAAN